ncbi:MAG: T9SS type A sorting domain-containing protein [Saprospiraceae bacterium]|nr:T9SS type A sorting domain-containing protein [Saprospiraceae bacterium]
MKRKLLFIIILIALFSCNAIAQSIKLDWAKSIGGTYSEKGESITTDIYGNVYVTGYFYLTVDFDPGVGVANLTSNGNKDIFVQKLDSLGNFLWAKSMGGVSHDYGTAIITDSNFIYTIGTFYDTVDFNPGSGITNLISNSGNDIFIQKLDYYGNLIWVKSVEGSGSKGCKSAITDMLGNLYITGNFGYTADFNPDSGVTNLNSNGEFDAFVVKLRQCTTISSSSIFETACFQYIWPINNQTYTESGIYATTKLNSVSCDSIITLNLTINTVDNSVTQNGTTLTANETGATYQWLDCNSSYAIISGATNQSYTATANGNYAVEITKNGCVDTSICYAITNIGIIENSFGDEFKFYPNPTEGKVNLELGAKFKNTHLILRNSEGKLIKHEEFKNKQNISLEIKGSKGIYLLEVVSGEGERAVIKVFKR